MIFQPLALISILTQSNHHMSEIILIDRLPAINKFMIMLEGSSNKRILQIKGIEKMGKSRLLREYRKLSEKQKKHCALIDLRSQFQSCSDIIFQITQQLPFSSWNNFIETQNQLRSAAKVEIKGIYLLLSAMSINISDQKKEDNDNYDRQRITSAFCRDLHSANLTSPLIILFDTFESSPPEIQYWLNEQFLAAVLQVPYIYLVFAGRSLPDLQSNWEDICDLYVLPPATLEDHVTYCNSLGIKTSKEIIEAFYGVFEGVPGLFAEYASKLNKEN